MGTRVSISFKKGDRESIALFDHWGGMARVKHAESYVATLRAEVAGQSAWPLYRLEPETVMVDYIRAITRGWERVISCLSVGHMDNPMRGDNSDNGHHVISLD